MLAQLDALLHEGDWNRVAAAEAGEPVPAAGCGAPSQAGSGSVASVGDSDDEEGHSLDALD